MTISTAHRLVVQRAAGRGSLLPQRVETELRAIERFARSDDDAITALQETIDAIWRIVERVGQDGALGPSRPHAHGLLAGRGFVQWGTSILSAVIRRGVAAGTFRPRCASWAIDRLPFAIASGACVHWVFGLSRGPSLRARTAVKVALDILSSTPRSGAAALRTQGRQKDATGRRSPGTVELMGAWAPRVPSPTRP